MKLFTASLDVTSLYTQPHLNPQLHFNPETDIDEQTWTQMILQLKALISRPVAVPEALKLAGYIKLLSPNRLPVEIYAEPYISMEKEHITRYLSYLEYPTLDYIYTELLANAKIVYPGIYEAQLTEALAMYHPQWLERLAQIGVNDFNRVAITLTSGIFIFPHIRQLLRQMPDLWNGLLEFTQRALDNRWFYSALKALTFIKMVNPELLVNVDYSFVNLENVTRSAEGSDRNLVDDPRIKQSEILMWWRLFTVAEIDIHADGNSTISINDKFLFTPLSSQSIPQNLII